MEYIKRKIPNLIIISITSFAEFIESKWPGLYPGLQRSMNQKCTDLYKNNPELRDM